MNREFEKLRDAAERKRQEANDAERELHAAERECRHQWGETMPDHIYEEGYTIPGDPPGTMGVDWRGPTYVEPKTTYRWKRVCKRCGRVEHTSRTQEHVTHTPVF